MLEQLFVRFECRRNIGLRGTGTADRPTGRGFKTGPKESVIGSRQEGIRA